MLAVWILLALPGDPPQAPASRPAAPDPAALVRTLSSPDAEAREAATDALRVLGAAAVPALRGGLEAGETEGRRLSAFLLGELEAKDAGTALRRSLRGDPEERVRAEAAYALAKTRSAGAAEVLAGALEHEGTARVLRAALVALADLRDPSRVEAVLAFAERSDDAYLRGIAARTLQDLTGRRYRNDLKAWRDWWTKYGERFLEMERERSKGRRLSAPAPGR